jgi:hypothetical protein
VNQNYKSSGDVRATPYIGVQFLEDYPWSVKGRESYIGAVVLLFQENHYNLITWRPPKQKSDTKAVSIFPRDLYPDMLRNMWCFLKYMDPH